MAALAPVKLNEDQWFYAYPRYMLLVTRIYDDNGAYWKTDQARIYWRTLRAVMPAKPKTKGRSSSVKRNLQRKRGKR